MPRYLNSETHFSSTFLKKKMDLESLPALLNAIGFVFNALIQRHQSLQYLCRISITYAVVLQQMRIVKLHHQHTLSS
jgi:hypothetical protein